MTFSTHKPYKSILVTLGSFFLLAACASVQTIAQPIDHRFSNGDRYIGNVTNGNADGCGIYISKDKSWYAGKYVSNNVVLGHSSWPRPDHHYLGEFSNNQRHGYGVYYFSVNERYEGQFRNGKFDGYGVYYHNNGSKRAGRWSKDKLVSTETVGAHHLIRAITAASQAVNTCRVSW
jgi:hypothetical protein